MCCTKSDITDWILNTFAKVLHHLRIKHAFFLFSKDSIVGFINRVHVITSFCTVFSEMSSSLFTFDSVRVCCEKVIEHITVVVNDGSCQTAGHVATYGSVQIGFLITAIHIFLSVLTVFYIDSLLCQTCNNSRWIMCFVWNV